jgi:hypothetical protein
MAFEMFKNRANHGKISPAQQTRGRIFKKTETEGTGSHQKVDYVISG